MADLNRTVGIIFSAQDLGAFAAASTLAEKISALGLNGVKAADAMAIMAQATAQLKTEAAKAASDVDSLGKNTDSAGKAASGAGITFANLRSILAVLGVSALVKDFFDANIQFEKTSLTLKAVTGDSQSAGREFDFVRQVASRLGLEVGATADQYAKLLAASKGTQLEGQPTRDILTAVAGAMATLGKSSSETGGVLNAITQIISKGTVQAEELRGQIGDRLPGAFNIAARAIGVTTDELNDLLKSGSVAAGDFLPKFAAELEKTFGTSGNINTYGAQVARFKSALDEFYVAIGQAGIIESAGNRLRFLADLVKVAGVEFGVFGKDIGAVFSFLSGNLSFSSLTEEIKKFEREAEQARAELDLKFNQTLAETNRLLRQNADAAGTSAAAFASNQTDAETERLLRQNQVLGDNFKGREDVNKALEALGVNAKKAASDFDSVLLKLNDLFKITQKNGEQAFEGFNAALKRARTSEDLDALAANIQGAFSRGEISGQLFDRAISDINKAVASLAKGLPDATDKIDKQAKAAEKATEKAEKFALELEKLASNERIKNIEATVTLKVANIEADTKRVIAAFESINNTVNSTESAISDLFGLFKNEGLSFSQLNLIRDQIDKENKRRDDALKLQGDLTRAQIDNLRAQTTLIAKGDALIKIDGAGLQPHLEAFMWEILKAVQVRVNAQGLSMLLGV